MSKARIEQMLQECLDGYEAGLTPEECLSAYPAHRAQLEPMLRQALSLRVAYAISPSDEFRHQMRENLMFAAGRDVQLALSSEPDPDFVLQERTRFLNLAGAAAQEALRDVPPPRLAFWVNARRRLLEAASTRPAPARRFGGMLRYSLSAAVAAIAITVGVVVMLDGGPAGNSADAQLAALEMRLTELEQRTLQGQAVTAGELEELAEQTSLITSTLDGQDLERAEKIGGLIVRQQEYLATQDTTSDPSLEEAQQLLAAAQQRLEISTGVTPTAAVAIVEPTLPPAEITPTPPAPTPTPEPLQPNEVRVEPSDDTYDLMPDIDWVRVTSSNIGFLMPDTWRLLVDEDEDGTLIQNPDSLYLALQTDDEDPIIILITRSGETIAQVNGVALTLRGADGTTVAPETLAAELGEIGIALHYFVLSIELTAP